MIVLYASGTTVKTVQRWLIVQVVWKISVMIAANMIVSNAMKSSAWSVFRKTNLSINVSTAINAIAGHAT